MNTFDLIKATVICGGLGFLVYSVPLVSQIVVLALLGFVWAFYAYKVVMGVAGKGQ